MGFDFVFNEDAENEYIESILWYEQQQTGLGDRFQKQIETILERIVKNPEHYPAKRKNYREAVVDVFPYIIVYQVFPELGTIYISAIHHGSRSPKTKYRKRK